MYNHCTLRVSTFYEMDYSICMLNIILLDQQVSSVSSVFTTKINPYKTLPNDFLYTCMHGFTKTVIALLVG